MNFKLFNISFILLLLSSCIDVEHDIPNVKCTSDGFMYNADGSIVDDPNTGAAIICEVY